MDIVRKARFDCADYLGVPASGRRLLLHKAKTAIFVQGEPAESVFYLRSGRAKLTVVSKRGKEATVTLLGPGDFMGEEALAGTEKFRKTTACAVTACISMKIEKKEMHRMLHDEPAFSDFFLKFMLARSMRTQADLVDQLFNSSERRLARILLLMADYGEPGEPESLLPTITQETLAEMIGTTRSRVSFFMNRFRKLGYIEYTNRTIRVHTSLLNAVLKESLPEENTARPKLLDPPPSATRTAKRAMIA